MANYTQWYKVGTISGSAGSNSINGTATYWTSAGINTGDILKIGGNLYEVLAVNNDNQITIAGTLETTISNSPYSIIRNFNATTTAKTASNVTGVMNEYARFLNTQMATITGKSAYDIAVEHGYVGTEEQWINAVSAGGQSNAVSSSLNFLVEALNSPIVGRAGIHNSIFRGKSLGTAVSDSQWTAIQSGSFDDLFIGDYWDINNVRYRIAHFDYYFNMPNLSNNVADSNGDTFPANSVSNEQFNLLPHHVVVIPDYAMGNAPMNTSETKTEMYGSCSYRKTTRKTFISTLEQAFGANHLMYWWDSFSSSSRSTTDFGKIADGRLLFVCQAELPNSIQLTGVHAVMNKGSIVHEGGLLNEGRIAGGQFQLFRLAPMFECMVSASGTLGYYSWNACFTRDVVDIADDGTIKFGCWNQQGIVSYVDALTSRYLRPYFCIMG